VLIKKLLVMAILLIAFLSGCSEEEQQLKGLISDKEGTYGLYIVGDEEVDGSKLAKEGIDESKIHTIYHPKSLQVAQESFSKAGIEKEPAYIVLDNKGIALKTYDYDELIRFLSSNIPKK
jgi:hypothetical protein